MIGIYDFIEKNVIPEDLPLTNDDVHFLILEYSKLVINECASIAEQYNDDEYSIENGYITKEILSLKKQLK